MGRRRIKHLRSPLPKPSEYTKSYITGKFDVIITLCPKSFDHAYVCIPSHMNAKQIMIAMHAVVRHSRAHRR